MCIYITHTLMKHIFEEDHWQLKVNLGLFVFLVQHEKSNSHREKQF